jgi:hypothetical protein
MSFSYSNRTNHLKRECKASFIKCPNDCGETNEQMEVQELRKHLYEDCVAVVPERLKIFKDITVTAKQHIPD